MLQRKKKKRMESSVGFFFTCLNYQVCGMQIMLFSNEVVHFVRHFLYLFSEKGIDYIPWQIFKVFFVHQQPILLPKSISQKAWNYKGFLLMLIIWPKKRNKKAYKYLYFLLSSACYKTMHIVWKDALENWTFFLLLCLQVYLDKSGNYFRKQINSGNYSRRHTCADNCSERN